MNPEIPKSTIQKFTIKYCFQILNQYRNIAFSII